MPNAKVLESKKAVVEALSGKIKEATSVVFVDYKGITVAQDTELRKQFREAGVEYSVVKNTLTNFAAKDCGYDFSEVLNGTTAMASTTGDPIALSYPLGGKYHIAHGVFNAILLTPVMRFNAQNEAFRERLALAYDRCCHEEVKAKTVDEKAQWMITRMEQIVKHLEIPTSLKEFNVPAEDLEGLVEAGMSVQRLLVNNMVKLTADDARKLYQEIL